MSVKRKDPLNQTTVCVTSNIYILIFNILLFPSFKLQPTKVLIASCILIIKFLYSIDKYDIDGKFIIFTNIPLCID